MCVACNHARFPATRPRVFCELKIMKIFILIYQIIQEKFAYGESYMLVMIGYIFIIKMVKKKRNSGLEIVAGLTRPLNHRLSVWQKLKEFFHQILSFLWIRHNKWLWSQILIKQWPTRTIPNQTKTVIWNWAMYEHSCLYPVWYFLQCNLCLSSTNECIHCKKTAVLVS